MDEHTLKVLEYDKIKNLLASRCYVLGAQLAYQLSPFSNQSQIEKSLAQIKEVKEIILQNEFQFREVPDIRATLQKVSVSGVYLDPKEFLQLSVFLSFSEQCKKFSKSIKARYPEFDKLCLNLKIFPEILAAIQKCIDEAGEVKDGASSKLASIRKEKKVVRQRILEKLEKSLSGKKGTSEEKLVTFRENRFVISVPAHKYSEVKGIIHDKSKTGNTFFVEPLAVIEQNNRLRELEIEEKNEIIRILIHLSDLVRKEFEDLQTTVLILQELDFIWGKARFALDFKALPPLLSSNGSIKLIQARHPLLKREGLVPLNLELGKDFSTLIITGPNTGGKTVALKTVGLLTLMALSGLEIPAAEGTEISLFDKVFADIGDEQSIEASLSTFSSHLSQIIKALSQAGDKSLVLLDELGAGTDPQEGAALGESILVYLLSRKVRTVATTHLGALKTLPYSYPDMQNGSLEFDTESLRPTYKFYTGIPGSSYGIEIAKKLGIQAEIAQKALQILGSQEKELGKLLQDLEKKLKSAEAKEKEASIQKETSEKLALSFKEKLEQVEKQRKELSSKTLKEQKALVEKTKLEMEHLIEELRKSKAEKEVIKKAQSLMTEKKTEIEKGLEEVKPPKRISSEKPKLGDWVWIESLRTQGEVISNPDKIGKVKVQTEKITISVNLDEIYKIQPKVTLKTSSPKLDYHPDSIKSELHLRGMTVDEALEKVDKYLDDAYLAGLYTVSLVHGKGTGTLRKRIKEFLENDFRVEEFKLGEWNEGGLGVTVVKLKR